MDRLTVDRLMVKQSSSQADRQEIGRTVSDGEPIRTNAC